MKFFFKKLITLLECYRIIYFLWWVLGGTVYLKKYNKKLFFLNIIRGLLKSLFIICLKKIVKKMIDN